MSRDSKVVEVLIASPSDVVDEREMIANVIAEWNSAHSRADGIMLQPLRWELDSVPGYGIRVQDVINSQIVEQADLLIAVFKHRLGSPTGSFVSGTVEEVESFRSTGRDVLMYFSQESLPHDHDAAQFKALCDYKAGLSGVLYRAYPSKEKLRSDVTHAVAKTMASLRGKLIPEASTEIGKRRSNRDLDLTPEATEMVASLAASTDGILLFLRSYEGDNLSVGGRSFMTDQTPRTVALWSGALDEIEKKGLVKPMNSERSMFQITSVGYKLHDSIEGSSIATKAVTAELFVEKGLSSISPGVVSIRFGVHNTSITKRIREYSCTVDVPAESVSFNSAFNAAEIATSTQAVRSFRYTEADHANKVLLPNERLVVLTVDLSIAHLDPGVSARTRLKSLTVKAVVDGESLLLDKQLSAYL